MTKTEVGEVTAVSKEGHSFSYKVRVPSVGIVVVAHAQVTPVRVPALEKGARLRVTHDLGRVQLASTDLSLTVLGRVRGIQRSPVGTSYRVEMDQGAPVQIHRDRIARHPEQRPLLVGAVLEVAFEDKSVRGARLVSEKERGTLARIDLHASTAQVIGESKERYTVRLPADVLQHLTVGEPLLIEIHYEPGGERKVVLERSSQPSAVSSQPEGRSSQRSAVSSQPEGRSYQPSAVSSQPERADSRELIADSSVLLGIDPAELARLKREGKHRYEIVSWLEQHAKDGLVEWYRLREGAPAQFAAPARPLDPLVQQAVRTTQPGFAGFFRHQAGALDAIRAGRSLVIVTQTASGKTLSYNPALFEHLLQNPSGHVLYVFPLNALMMDQKEKIDDLRRALVGSSGTLGISAEILVGGLGTERRNEIARSSPNILATNPEMLSVMLSESQSKWRGFFSGLQYIVLDEVHTYRGMFGVHMSSLMRRLLLAARRCGADPRFILCSATVSNPLDLATRLTSLPTDQFDLLDEQQDGSQQRDKHWTVLNPDWGTRKALYASYQEVAAAVFCELLTRKNERGVFSPLNTILFCRSIREVNRVSRLVRQRLERSAPALRDKVKTYISAELTIDAKREIYDGLRSGRYLGVISTNALEAGIDIGGLDACIIAGFPFSVMALRQMAGRVGRKDEGLVCYIPYPLSSLDDYYRDHPDLLLHQPPEVFVVDPENPYISRKHINAAALENGGLSASDLAGLWGERANAIAIQAEKDGAMRRNGARWMGTRRSYTDPTDLYAVQSLRSNAQQPYAVCLDDGQPCDLSPACFDPAHRRCPRRVTALDRSYVYRDCHPGAVFEAADGKLYRVTQFDDAAHVVRVSELPDDTLERTHVEEDLHVEMSGTARAVKKLAPGIELAWGDVTVRRLFTGYFTYRLVSARRCRRCRREYDETIDTCPTCGHPTEASSTRSRSERKDFPPEYPLGFSITLKTSACWLSIQPGLEDQLQAASTCKLPGEQNRVLAWLRKPLDLEHLPARLRLTPEEKQAIQDYHRRASEALKSARPSSQETVLFLGVYGQCVMGELRSLQLSVNSSCQPSAVSSQPDKDGDRSSADRDGRERADSRKLTAESRSLEIFQALTGYPVTEDLRHVCRKCMTSTLFPAMHTLEHAVDARYPSVALGDRSDLGAYTTLGHAGTGAPTVFWFDNYEGGLGAAEKVFEQFTRLLETGLEVLQTCSCATLEGCPRCTYVPDCSEGNEELNKLAGRALIDLILHGKTDAVIQSPRAFLYRKKRSVDFDREYQDNEFVREDHGYGSEAPAGPTQTQKKVDPYLLLRLQPRVHELVVQRAYEARSHEIDEEVPPVSAADLNAAYRQALSGKLLQEWKLEPGQTPYETLEVLPEASLKMIQQIYRAIALQVHPDANPGRTAWANEMMKRLNAAYGEIVEKRE
jgi:DEAD/DEAH box helicase domain-containing protein